MPTQITIDFKGLKEFESKLKDLPKKIIQVVDEVLDANALDIVEKAKQLAPVDLGGLRGTISTDLSKPLEKHIAVNVFYAAYVEFGTGRYAEQYAASLPNTWRQYAAQFRGRTGQTGFLQKIQEWVRRKGIGTAKNYKSVGYLIYRSILTKGIKPQPFLLPAIEQQKPLIIRDIENALKNIK